jgi:hypothetical protein
MISENTAPKYCVELFDQFIEKVTSRCTFAKIVLSLPFLTVRDVELNEYCVSHLLQISLYLEEKDEYHPRQKIS